MKKLYYINYSIKMVNFILHFYNYITFIQINQLLHCSKKARETAELNLWPYAIVSYSAMQSSPKRQMFYHMVYIEMVEQVVHEGAEESQLQSKLYLLPHHLTHSTPFHATFLNDICAFCVSDDKKYNCNIKFKTVERLKHHRVPSHILK